MAKSKRLAGAAALLALLVGTLIGFEDLRTEPYLDGGGVPTVCAGETQGVKLTDRYTVAECKAMLVRSVDQYAAAIEQCVSVALPDERYVALVSLAYNIGADAACRSTAVRRINEGRVREGCDAFLMWNKDNGKVVRGLTNRRQAERALCLVGVSP